jgi:hypothetical protein
MAAVSAARLRRRVRVSWARVSFSLLSSGRTAPREVTALIRGGGVKHLVDVRVDEDHDVRTAPAVITATAHHPFWVPAAAARVDAGDLVAGVVQDKYGGIRSMHPIPTPKS